MVRQIYQYDPIAGYKFVPEIKARIMHSGGGYLVRTNRAGFQSDHEFIAKKRPDKRRVLLFGDSFTAGEGVSSGFRYSDCLEEMLPDLEIYNYGLPASGTDQHYLLYREYGKPIESDLLVIGVFIENIRRVASRYRRWVDKHGKPILFAKPYFVLQDGKLALKGSPPQKAGISEAELESTDRQFIARTVRFPRLKKVFNWARENRYLKSAMANRDFRERLMKVMRYQPIKEYDDPQNAGWQVMRSILIEWIKEHDGPVLVVPIPLFHHVAGIADPSSYQARLSEATAAGGGQFFDPLEGMRQTTLQDCRDLYFDDGHLTKKGHRVLAESLAPKLSELLELQPA